MKTNNLIFGLTLFTAIGIIFYWIAVFLGIFPVQETIPGYQQWFMAFPLADFWIAGCSLLASIFLLRDDERAIPMGISTGSSLIFLGLYALLYGFNTGLLFILTIDEIIEICIKVYCLTVGPYLIISFWQMR